MNEKTSYSGIVNYFGMILLSFALRAFAMVKIWEWFIVSKFNTPYLSLPLAIGIQLFLHLVFVKGPTMQEVVAATNDVDVATSDKTGDTLSSWDKMSSESYWKICFTRECSLTVSIVVTLFMAYCVKFFL